jgi:hypothetical protein
MHMHGMNMRTVHIACGWGKDIANTMISIGSTAETSKPIWDWRHNHSDAQLKTEIR